MSRYAHSLLQVQLQPGGGYSLALQGPERQASAQLLKHRLPGLQPFLELAAAELVQRGHPQACFLVQLHDEDSAPPCFRFDAPLDPAIAVAGPLIPDPYALASQGYAALRRQFADQPLPPWRERLPVAIWRGSSTGTPALTPANLAHNLRYQLCAASRQLGPPLDARFTAVVQSPDAASRRALEQLLLEQQLLTAKVSPWHLALHRWILEIDGNVNSWGLLWKLLSGSCVLRVSSPRRQWYHHRLVPWQHVVPVAANLSNLAEVLDWCQRNPQRCAAIAQAGQALAMEVVHQLEQDQRQAVARYATTWLRTRAA